MVGFDVPSDTVDVVGTAANGDTDDEKEAKVWYFHQYDMGFNRPTGTYRLGLCFDCRRGRSGRIWSLGLLARWLGRFRFVRLCLGRRSLLRLFFVLGCHSLYFTTDGLDLGPFTPGLLFRGVWNRRLDRRGRW
jgi:hypothetical protein